MAVSLLRRPREMSTGMQGLVRMVVVSPLAGMKQLTSAKGTAAAKLQLRGGSLQLTVLN